jgi:hypothetical protein
VPFDDQLAVEAQNFAYQPMVLIPGGDDDGVDALIDALDEEPKVRMRCNA